MVLAVCFRCAFDLVMCGYCGCCLRVYGVTSLVWICSFVVNFSEPIKFYFLCFLVSGWGFF